MIVVGIKEDGEIIEIFELLFISCCDLPADKGGIIIEIGADIDGGVVVNDPYFGTLRSLFANIGKILDKIGSYRRQLPDGV